MGALLGAALLLAPATAQGKAGDLDPEFGQGGLAFVEQDQGSVGTLADVATYEAGTQAGKLLAIGPGDGPTTLMARFHSNGSLDSGFGGDGVVLADSVGAAKVALYGDGRILIGGFGQIRRFTADGNPDSSFGSCRCGRAVVVPNAQLTDVEIDRSGSDAGEILFSGWREVSIDSSSSYTIAFAGRVTAAGAVRWVREFSINENPTVSDTSWNNYGVGVAEDPNGDMVVAGWRYLRSSSLQRQRELGAVRLNPDGTFDGGFGTAGGVGHDITATISYPEATEVAVDSLGRPLITGSRNVPAAYCPPGPIIRLTTGGALDPGFSGDGITTGVTHSREIAIDSAGRIVASGQVNCVDTVSRDAGAVRLLADGSRDPAFGSNGTASVDGENASSSNIGYGMALDGRGVLVAGSIHGKGALARFLHEATADGPAGGPPGSGGSGGVAGGVATNFRNINVHKLVVPKSRQKLAARGVKVLASCDEDCRIVLELRVSQAIASEMGLTGTLLARGSRIADAGQKLWVRARFNGAVRRALRSYDGGGRLQVDVTGLAR